MIFHFLAIVPALLSTLLSRYYVHMLQLEGYFLSQYRVHLFARLRKPALFFRGKAKKPLKYTARVKRLFAFDALVNLLFCIGLSFLPGWWKLSMLLALPLCSCLLWVAAVLALPLEKAIAAWFVHDARRRLASRKDLKIIGITGSYGKTSTKFILSSILSEKYAVLTPPASYNTTMGVVRVIREQLQPDDQVFLCEMGARHLGDIDEICRLVHPQMAVITSIGPQHLETFGSLENIRRGKGELVRAVGKDGIAIFPSGCEQARLMYDEADCRKLYAGFREEDSVCASDSSVGVSGSAFTLRFPDGSTVECFTRLLGEHNISNIALAALAAWELGLTKEEIARGIFKLQPVEHRLQIVSSRPVTVIDDAFNSSPDGARAACRVLSRFVGRRIIVTPGFVELGEKQDAYHEQFGEAIRESADIAILVGSRRTAGIARALQDWKGTLYTVEALEEATALLGKISVGGDVVLFENDLPDNY